MSAKDLKITEWDRRSAALLAKARTLLESDKSDFGRGLARRIPVATVDKADRIKIVFCGAYSAGKSSILKALTGRDDIAIGAGIVTAQATTYSWRGYDIIDTPGIHTKERPDHDEITYREISESDLLVFVVTADLFDNHLGQHFRTLAITHSKAHEMMLVVNKMDRDGNTAERQSIKRRDLLKVLTPYTPEDLWISFVDAEEAIESVKQTDPERKQRRWFKSGFDTFKEQLNNFAISKGMDGKFARPLYVLEQILLEASNAEPTDNPDLAALELLLLQNRRAISETRDRIKMSVASEVQKVQSQILMVGDKAANTVQADAETETINEELIRSQEKVDSFAVALGESVERRLQSEMNALGLQLQRNEGGAFAKEALHRLAALAKEAVQRINMTDDGARTLRGAGDYGHNLGKYLLKHSFNPSAPGLKGIMALQSYTGTATHETVKVVGKFVGKSFKPWEAVKWTKHIANAGRAFVIIGAFVSLAMQYKEDVDAAKLERDLQERRASLRSGFVEASHQIQMHYDQATKSYIANSLDLDLQSLDEKLLELRSMRNATTERSKELASLLTETRNLIEELHSVNSIQRVI